MVYSFLVGYMAVRDRPRLAVGAFNLCSKHFLTVSLTRVRFSEEFIKPPSCIFYISIFSCQKLIRMFQQGSDNFLQAFDQKKIFLLLSSIVSLFSAHSWQRGRRPPPRPCASIRCQILLADISNTHTGETEVWGLDSWPDSYSGQLAINNSGKAVQNCLPWEVRPSSLTVGTQPDWFGLSC